MEYPLTIDIVKYNDTHIVKVLREESDKDYHEGVCIHTIKGLKWKPASVRCSYTSDQVVASQRARVSDGGGYWIHPADTV